MHNTVRIIDQAMSGLGDVRMVRERLAVPQSLAGESTRLLHTEDKTQGCELKKWGRQLSFRV